MERVESLSKRLIGLLMLVLACCTSMIVVAYTSSRNVASTVGPLVVVAQVKGVISGATADYISSAISYAERRHAILVLELDTPGGSLEAALRVREALESSSIPVISYVVGTWAVSAGTLILECSHIAAMQPGTVIGAMQPVAYNPATGSYTPIKEPKILNPVYKAVEACMKLYGRNATLARKFVYDNLVLEASEAREVKAVNYVAENLLQLLKEVNGTIVKTRIGLVRLYTWPPRIEYYGMPLGLQIAQALSDPLVASILMSIAMIIILASILSGHIHFLALGIALILLSFFGLGYSVNTLALVMLIIGLIMLIIELTVIPGFGIVGYTGIALIALSIIMLPFRKPASIAPTYMQQTIYISLSVTIPLAILTSIIVIKLVQARRKEPLVTPIPIGRYGYAVDDIGEDKIGFVKVEGELWQARSRRGFIKAGSRVIVVGKDDSILIVEKVDSGYSS